MTLRQTLIAALMLTAAPALAFDPASMSDSERAAFRAEIRAYLVEHPEVIFEAVDAMKAREAAQAEEADKAMLTAYHTEIFEDGYSWVSGNPEGDVTLVEFMDYRCGYCRRAVPEVARLLKEDGNIRLIVKEFPILGDASMISSRFAIATRLVAGDAAYAQVHDALLALDGDVSDAILRRLADGLGLDADPILARMDSEEVTREIAANRDLAQRLQINGTPTFVLESQMLRGFVPADQMAQLVAQERG